MQPSTNKLPATRFKTTLSARLKNNHVQPATNKQPESSFKNKLSARLKMNHVQQSTNHIQLIGNRLDKTFTAGTLQTQAGA